MRGPDDLPIGAEVAEQLDALRETLDNARTMPMSSSVMVNKSDLGHLVERLEASVQAAVTDAHDVLARRDQVLVDGASEVEEMLRQARLERDRLVQDTEVWRSALREADRIRAEADEDSQALRDDADSYVAERLATFEGTLDSTLEAVRRGRERLDGQLNSPRNGQLNGSPSTTSKGRPGGRIDGRRRAGIDPFAALGDDRDVDAIKLPEHLDR